MLKKLLFCKIVYVKIIEICQYIKTEPIPVWNYYVKQFQNI